MQVEKLTAKQILAVPMDQPEKVYTGEESVCKMEYRILAKRWHPDHTKGNNDVFVHIKLLYELAIDRIADGIWKEPGLLKLTALNGSVHRMRYLRMRPFELGEMYIGSAIVGYAIKTDYKDLIENAERMVRSLTYADDKMRGEVSRYVPIWYECLRCADRYFVTLRKDPEHICVRDLLIKLGGKIEPKQVAWIMSRLHNLLCYFEWAGIVHNDISLDNYFISPAGHIGSLIGGWWYAKRVGQRMVALPERTIRYAKPDCISSKKAAFSTDAELIRALGRECLGDAFGNKLVLDKSVPKAMLNWLQSPGSGNAYEDYNTWYNTVLTKSFGPRRFVPMPIPAGIYD